MPGVVTLTTLHKVLQNLLDEKVPIRDMRTIMETLANMRRCRAIRMSLPRSSVLRVGTRHHSAVVPGE